MLGKPRMLVLGLQHMFAMFGATVLVPLITGLSVSTTLLCAGLGTLLFHLITGGKVPAFLGSSFAYLGGFAIVAPMLMDESGQQTVPNTEMLPYACAGVALSGLVYVMFSLLISIFGIRRIMKLFPPRGDRPHHYCHRSDSGSFRHHQLPEQLAAGLCGSGHRNRVQHLGQGHDQILPILLGVLVSYVVALVTGAVDFSSVMQADWFGIPLNPKSMGLFAIDGSPEFISAVLTIVPIAVATMMEHMGDVSSICATVGENFTAVPRSQPHPHRGWPRHQHCRPVRRPGQHHLR